MKLIIQGNLIETEYIYSIGEPTSTGSEYGFVIGFVNQNNIIISITYAKFPKLSYNDVREMSKLKIDNAHEKLIEIWKENQSCIPKIEI